MPIALDTAVSLVNKSLLLLVKVDSRVCNIYNNINDKTNGPLHVQHKNI